MTIKLQLQPDRVTCVSACAAMLLDRPVEAVVDEFHQKFMDNELDLDMYLKQHGVIAIRQAERSMIGHEHVYVLLVPSLNAVGHFHQVLCDTRNGGFKIYDPARPGAQRYVSSQDATGTPGETEILTWVVDYVVKKAPAIGIGG